jgi:hypothetical protein
MAEVRHEIRAIMYTGHSKMLPDGADDAMDDGASVQAWRKLVVRLIQVLKKFPDDSDCLPDSFKRDLARSIKQGKKLCQGGGAALEEARNQINRANLLYHKLSGASYV